MITDMQLFPGHIISRPVHKLSEDEIKELSLRYYNSDIHKAALCYHSLPRGETQRERIKKQLVFFTKGLEWCGKPIYFPVPIFSKIVIDYIDNLCQHEIRKYNAFRIKKCNRSL